MVPRSRRPSCARNPRIPAPAHRRLHLARRRARAFAQPPATLRAQGGLRTLLQWLPLRHEAVESEAPDFAEIEARFFTGRPRAPVYSKCISSRHFDPAGTGTCQILLRGRYNDILRADEHYIALDHDFGNVATVIERFRDPGERKRVADNVNAYVRAEHTYRERLAALHRILTR